MQVAARDGMRGLCRQGVGMEAGVGEHGEPLGKLLGGGGSEFVGLGHGAGGGIGVGQIVALQFRLAGLAAHLVHGRGDLL